MSGVLHSDHNGTHSERAENSGFDQDSLYIGVGVGAGLLFSLALLAVVAAVACVGQRRGGRARTARITSTVSLARSDFDSYKSGSHYYITGVNNGTTREKVKDIRRQTRSLPSWPIAHALPAGNSRGLECGDNTEVSHMTDGDDDVFFKDAKASRLFRNRSSSAGRKWKESNNTLRKTETARRGSESSIRLPEVKSVFGGTYMTSSSHSLATLSLNFHKPHARMSELFKFREGERERYNSN